MTVDGITPAKKPEPGVRCVDSESCKQFTDDDKSAEQLGWKFLEASRKWRCPACVRALDAVNFGQHNG